MNQLMTRLFVEQPLASPGSAKNVEQNLPKFVKGFCVTKHTSQILVFLDFKPCWQSATILDKNRKLWLSQQAKLYDVYHPFMTTSFLEQNIFLYRPRSTCGKICNNSARIMNVWYSSEKNQPFGTTAL